MTSKTGIIFLQRDKFQVYSPYLSSILEFRFVPEFIRDFDLINKDLLENLLRVFISNNKIPPSGMAIVIADNASFIKDFVSQPPQNPQTATTPLPTLEELQKQANDYIDQVPFESVCGKTFPIATGVRAYATNQEIFEAIKAILDKLGFIVEVVIPGFAFDQGISSKPAIDGQSVSLILQKFSTLKEFNLLKEQAFIQETTLNEEPEEKEQKPTEEKSKKRIVIIAAGTFLIIFALTGYVLYTQFAATSHKAKPIVRPSVSANVSVSPTPSQNNSLVPISTAKDLTVEIITSSAGATSSGALRTSLSNFGFKSVTSQTDENISTTSNLISFSNKVPSDLRNSIVSEAKKVAGNVVVQDKTGAAFDIIIILGE